MVMDAAYERAEVLLKQGQVAAAVPHLEAAIQGMPAGWSARKDHPDRLEIAFWDRADFLAYVAHAKPTKNVVWTIPSYSRACYYLGFGAVERHDFALAERWIDRGLALEPDHPLLLCEKGLILGNTKRRDQSMEVYRRGTKASPWNHAWTARAHRGLGFELVELRRLDEAEAEFRRSLELDPEHPVAKNELAVIADLRSGRVTGTASGLTRGGGQSEAQQN